MALKGNKTLKPDNVILVDYKKAHNDDKQELAQIDNQIEAKDAELIDLITTYEARSLSIRLELQALKDRKLSISDRVAKNTEIIGE